MATHFSQLRTIILFILHCLAIFLSILKKNNEKMTYEHVWNSFQYNLLSDDEYMKTFDLLKLQDSDVIWEIILEAYRNTNRPFSKTHAPSLRDHCSFQEVRKQRHTIASTIFIYPSVSVNMSIRKLPAFFCLSLYDINKDILASATSPHHLVVRVDCTAIYGLIKPVCKRVAASICYHIVRITITIWWYHLH